ncbi:galactoside 2-alpha-L-fucosyltransferase SEC1 [Hyalella azteca]|uniref:L-Fucosyltransferase n=1 Tax=Hyalella azteca TaxID=294128 RepID=A0A8B7P5P9_HYAAZ|nr:galactoside 2-alpha-L-fucosyltransferase SEC1 [Hyalella azteca]
MQIMNIAGVMFVGRSPGIVQLLTLVVLVLLGLFYWPFKLTGYNIDFEKYSRITENVNSRSSNCSINSNCSTDVTVVAQFKSLVLRLTGINRTSVVMRLESTLHGAADQLPPLLQILQEFEAKYKCEACVDSRPSPRTVLDFRVRLEHNVHKLGLAMPAIVMNPKGRLGNQMGEYATIYALRKIYNATVVRKPVRRHLEEAFSHLTIPSLERFKEGDWVAAGFDSHRSTFNNVQLAAAGLLGPHPFITPGTPFETCIFAAFRAELREEFRFDDNVTQQAEARLRRVREATAQVEVEGAGLLVTVGIHVRLTDYPHHMESLYSVRNITNCYGSYMKNAINYFLQRHVNVAFLVASDDVNSTRSLIDELRINNVFFSEGTPLVDMYALSMCDHHIITLGTYGFWTAFLGSGTTIFPVIDSTTGYRYSKTLYDSAGLGPPDFVPIPMVQ